MGQFDVRCVGAMQRLERCLESEDIELRVTCAITLATLGAWPLGRKIILEQLAAEVVDITLLERIFRLATTRSLQVAEFLDASTKLFAGTRDSNVAYTAFDYLLVASQPESLRTLILSMCDNGDARVRVRGAKYMSKVVVSGDAPAIQALRRLLVDESAVCRFAAAASLVALGEPPDSALVGVLRQLLTVKENGVHGEAAMVLAQAGDLSAECTEVLWTAVEARDDDLGARAAFVLAKNAVPKSATHRKLWKTLKNGTSMTIEREICEGMGSIGPPIVPFCLEVLEGRDYEMHGYAFSILELAEQPPGANVAHVIQTLRRSLDRYLALGETVTLTTGYMKCGIEAGMLSYVATHVSECNDDVIALLQFPLRDYGDILKVECLCALIRLNVDVDRYLARLRYIATDGSQEFDREAVELAQSKLALRTSG